MKDNNISFLCGSIFTTFVIAMSQDFMGKEKYIDLVNSNWLQAHWGVWVIPIIIVVYVHTKIVAREINGVSR